MRPGASPGLGERRTMGHVIQTLTDRAALISPAPLLTRAEARMLGIPLSTARHRRVRSGVYVEAAAWRALRPWERYQTRVHAFLRAHPDAVLCLESAAVVHGLPLFGETRDIHVYDPDRSASRRFGDVCVHTSEVMPAIELVGGILVTTLAETAVAVGAVAPPAQGLAAFDAATSPAQGGHVALDRLETLAKERVSSRGRARLRWLCSTADPRTESSGESISRAVILWSGFEHPELQASFHYEGTTDRTDFFFSRNGAVGESDGWGKYDLADPDAAARALAHEKRREDRLRRNGHAFARWDYADTMRIDPLCRALRAAGVRVTRPAEPAMLATLRTSPRSL